MPTLWKQEQQCSSASGNQPWLRPAGGGDKPFVLPVFLDGPMNGPEMATVLQLSKSKGGERPVFSLGFFHSQDFDSSQIIKLGMQR